MMRMGTARCRQVLAGDSPCTRPEASQRMPRSPEKRRRSLPSQSRKQGLGLFWVRIARRRKRRRKRRRRTRKKKIRKQRRKKSASLSQARKFNQEKPRNRQPRRQGSAQSKIKRKHGWHAIDLSQVALVAAQLDTSSNSSTSDIEQITEAGPSSASRHWPCKLRVAAASSQHSWWKYSRYVSQVAALARPQDSVQDALGVPGLLLLRPYVLPVKDAFVQRVPGG